MMPFTEGVHAFDRPRPTNLEAAVSSFAFVPGRIHHLSETPRMSASEFTVSIDQRYFEDYVPGSVHEYGPVTVSEAEIIDFAKKFDAQPIHTDPQRAAAGPFGGLIASGWHTASLMMRLYSDKYVSRVAAIAPPEVDELRWTKPVRPGASLSLRITVMESTRSQSNLSIGTVRALVEVFNQHREIVMSMKARNLLRCRNSSK